MSSRMMRKPVSPKRSVRGSPTYPMPMIATTALLSRIFPMSCSCCIIRCLGVSVVPDSWPSMYPDRQPERVLPRQNQSARSFPDFALQELDFPLQCLVLHHLTLEEAGG